MKAALLPFGYFLLGTRRSEPTTHEVHVTSPRAWLRMVAGHKLIVGNNAGGAGHHARGEASARAWRKHAGAACCYVAKHTLGSKSHHAATVAAIRERYTLTLLWQFLSLSTRCDQERSEDKRIQGMQS